MTTRLNPYLNFRDNAKEAMAFYHSIFGGELTSSTFAEFQASQDPNDNDKIMHSQLVTGSGLALMAADVPSSMEYSEGKNGTISLSGDDEAELRGYWEKLSADGSVVVPLETAPWGDSFGWCTDKFGVAWMVNIAANPAES
jgi:PhnB protein